MFFIAVIYKSNFLKYTYTYTTSTSTSASASTTTNPPNPKTTNPDNENLTLSGEPISTLHGSTHWSFERAMSVATLGLIIASPIYPHPMVNFGLGIVIPLHCHIGFGSIITDYLPVRKFPLIYRFARGILYASTGLTIYGLYKYNTEDVGIIEGIKNIWSVKKIKFTDE